MENIHEFDCLKDNQYFSPSNIEVRFVSGQIGLGVFAAQPISKDSIIERCPFIELNWRSKYYGDRQIHRYFYTTGKCECNECKTHGAKMLMVLGYGMIYNHQDNPNGLWRFDHGKKYADVIAAKDIEAGQQIFVSYGEGYFKNRAKEVLE